MSAAVLAVRRSGVKGKSGTRLRLHAWRNQGILEAAAPCARAIPGHFEIMPIYVLHGSAAPRRAGWRTVFRLGAGLLLASVLISLLVFLGAFVAAVGLIVSAVAAVIYAVRSRLPVPRPPEPPAAADPAPPGEARVIEVDEIIVRR
jgi:hypothetical protein